jgi:hypothetical protein
MQICLAGAHEALAQDQARAPRSVAVHAGVRYAEGFVLDIYVPDDPGPFPTAMTLHGASRGKAAMSALAAALAEQGFIVFNPTWLVQARPFDADAAARSFDAAGCALRYVGAASVAFSGDGEPVTIVALSAGGLSGALLSLGATEFGGRACEVSEPMPAVGLFVGLEGGYSNAIQGSGLAETVRPRPDLVRRLDPPAYLDRARNLSVVLFLGDQFRPAVAPTEWFTEVLRGAGIPTELRHVSGPHLASTFTQGVLELLAEQRRP